MEKQTTIKKQVSFSGTGLHTGNNVTMTFKPAPANTGYIFIRTDLEGNPQVEALTDNVVDLSRGTTIEKGEAKVLTVEHVLAALVGLEIDNCYIELDNNEPPVVDGSSMPYAKALMEAGIEQLDAEREYFELQESIGYKEEERHVEIVALPTDDYRITVMVDYFNPALGSQHTGMFNLKEEFVKEFAPARTFCFLSEVLALRDAGLIKGGSLNNALVIVDKEMNDEEKASMKTAFELDKDPECGENGYLNNTELRYKNEPARHKLLDMLGDLALIGVRIKAQVLAARPGHKANFEFSKKIRAKYLEWKEVQQRKGKVKDFEAWDIKKLMSILPHRYPFLMIDRVVDYIPEEHKIIGYKNVTINEPFFQGHFPGQPVMPGVLILEAMAQAGGLNIMFEVDDISTKLALFTSINNAKFRKQVVPGDKLVLEVKRVQKRFNIYTFKGTAYVDGEVAASADLQAALVDKEV